MAVAYDIRPLDLNHSREQIRGLWTSGLSGISADAAERKLDIGYLGNPVDQGMCFGLVDGPQSEIVGVQCLHTRTLHWKHQQFRAGCLSDFVVDARHRSLGPALTLMKTTVVQGQSQGETVYGFPNEKAQAICKRAGLASRGGMVRYGRLLRLEYLLGTQGSGGMLRSVASVANRLLQMATDLVSAFTGPALRCRASHWDDPALGEIWARRPQDYVLADRSPEALRWRYSYDAHAPWNLAIVEDKQGQAIGYVVWQMQGSRMAFVSDFFCTAPQEQLAGLLHAFSRLAAAEGAVGVVLEFIGNDHLVSQIHRGGFLRRSARGELFVGKRLPDGLQWDLTNSYVTGFDRDTH